MSSSDGSIRYILGSALLRSTLTYLLSHRTTSSPPQKRSPPWPNGSNDSRSRFFFCKIVLSHSESWKNRAGRLEPARVLITTLPNHQPRLGGRMSMEYMLDNGSANAYRPMLNSSKVAEVGTGGTR